MNFVSAVALIVETCQKTLIDSHTILIGDKSPRDSVFTSEALQKISQTELHYPILSVDDYADHSDLLAKADFILSTWGMPKLTKEFLALMPKLKAVFYAAGSVKGFVTEESWSRGIIICSAAEANAVPVAEYTLGAILLSLKRFWHHTALTKAQKWERCHPLAGGYESKVGLVSLGAIARRVAHHLQNFDIEVLAYDPFASEDMAKVMGVRLVSLATLFAEADVVSLHSPWIQETVGMIDQKLLERMKSGATLINTARGALINEADLCRVMSNRPDLTALLDVTHPEPPERDSPLYTLGNVFLTPHIAGSVDAECRRMVAYMAEEIQRYTTGRPLQHQVTQEMLATMA